MSEQVLDHPRGFDSSNQPWMHRLNVMDYYLNLILIAIVGVTAIIGTVSQGFIFVALFGLFWLGVYQLTSGLIGAVRGNQAKRIYLLVSIVFLLVSGLIGFTLYQQGYPKMVALYALCLGLFLSFIGAIYYTILCYQAKKRTAS